MGVDVQTIRPGDGKTFPKTVDARPPPRSNSSATTAPARARAGRPVPPALPAHLTWVFCPACARALLGHCRARSSRCTMWAPWPPTARYVSLWSATRWRCRSGCTRAQPAPASGDTPPPLAGIRLVLLAQQALPIHDRRRPGPRWAAPPSLLLSSLLPLPPSGRSRW